MKLRTLVPALALAFVAVSAKAQSPCDSSRPVQRDTAHYRITGIYVSSVRLHVETGPAHGATLWVHRDSLAQSARVGYMVRRCNHPVTRRGAPARVTWCIDHKASGIR